MCAEHELLRQHVAKAQAEGRFRKDSKSASKTPQSRIRTRSRGSRNADNLSPAAQPLKPLQPSSVHSKIETDNSVTPTMRVNKSTSLSSLFGEKESSHSHVAPTNEVSIQQPPFSQPVISPSSLVETIEEPPPPQPSIDWGDSDDEKDFQEVPMSTPGEDGTLGSEGSVEVSSIPSVPEDLKSSLDQAGANNQDFYKLDMEDYMEVEEEVIVKKEITDEDVERLHSEQIGNLNGNKDKDGVFREWHETVSVESYKQEVLQIMPYTLIEF